MCVTLPLWEKHFSDPVYVIMHRDPVEVSDLAVNGDDLLHIGISGKRLGETLRALLRYVLEDPSRNTRDSLLSRARSDA